jgi:hypothetical protein
VPKNSQYLPIIPTKLYCISIYNLLCYFLLFFHVNIFFKVDVKFYYQTCENMQNIIYSYKILLLLYFLSQHRKYFRAYANIIPDAFHLRSDMTFPHVDQSSLFFNMFFLLPIGQKLHTQFLKFSPPSFFYGSSSVQRKI